MKASEILQERRLTKKEHTQTLSDANIRFGFECELLLDDSSTRSAVDPDDLSWDDLKRYLNITDRQQKLIDARLGEWQDDKINQLWLDDRTEFTLHWLEKNNVKNDENLPEPYFVDEYADEAQEHWERKHIKRIRHENNMDDFIRGDFAAVRDFIETFKLTALYGTTDDGLIRTEDGDDQDDRRRQAAESIARNLDVSFKVHSSYHQTEKESRFWYIEPDDSLTSENGIIGAEVVSSVYPIKEGAKKLSQLLDWINHNASTDDSTSVHINLSIYKKTLEDYDFLKMMIFHDENYVASVFGRLGNEYCEQMRSKLYRKIKASTKEKSTNVFKLMKTRDFATVLDTLRSLGQSMRKTFDRKSSINARDNGVFEFRTMGGAKYQTRKHEIIGQITNMANLLRIGSDPEMLAKEYIIKVFNILEAGKFGNDSIGGPKSLPEIPHDLNSFGTLLRERPVMVKDASEDPYGFLYLISTLLVDGVIGSLTTRQNRQLKFYVRRHKIDSKRFIQRAFNSEKYNVIANIMGWPVFVPTEDGQQTLPLAKPTMKAEKSVDDEPKTFSPMAQRNLPLNTKWDWNTNAMLKPQSAEDAYADWQKNRK